MATRIKPLKPEESQDEQVNELLKAGQDGWWQDSQMFGVIGRRPELLKAIIPAIEAFFAKGIIEPYIFELMRIKTGEANNCAY